MLLKLPLPVLAWSKTAEKTLKISPDFQNMLLNIGLIWLFTWKVWYENWIQPIIYKMTLKTAMLLSLQSPFFLPLTSKSCVGARIASWHSSALPFWFIQLSKRYLHHKLLIYSFCLVILFNSWLYYEKFLVFFTFVLICSFMQYFQHSINLITTFPMSLQLYFTILLHLKCARNMCARTIV